MIYSFVERVCETRQKGQHIDWPFQGLIDQGKRIDPFALFVLSNW